MGDIADFIIGESFSEECEFCGELIAYCTCGPDDFGLMPEDKLYMPFQHRPFFGESNER